MRLMVAAGLFVFAGLLIVARNDVQDAPYFMRYSAILIEMLSVFLGLSLVVAEIKDD